MNKPDARDGLQPRVIRNVGDEKMKYEDGQTVMLGDIVRVGLHDGDHVGRVIIIGDTGECDGVDARTAKWALESGHVGKLSIMLEWSENNPLASDDPKYAPVTNTLSTSLCGVVMVRRKEQAPTLREAQSRQ